MQVKKTTAIPALVMLCLALASAVAQTVTTRLRRKPRQPH